MTRRLLFAAAAFAMVLISRHAAADPSGPKGIAVLAADNQSDLTALDLTAIQDRVSAAFKLLPNNQYAVGTFAERDTASVEALPCDETCLVGKAREGGAMFAVSIKVAALTAGRLVTLSLYCAKTGQLIASETASSETGVGELVSRVEFAAKKLSDALPKTTALPQGQSAAAFSRTENSHGVAFRNPNAGTLIVTSEPDGAVVHLGGRMGQRFVGTTPYEGELVPHRYRIIVSLKGYREVTRDVALAMGETKRVRFDLFKSKRWIAAGHGLLWPGVVAGAVSGILLGSDKTTPGAVFAAVGGTLMGVGIPVLVVGHVKFKREKTERKRHTIVAGPLNRGFSFMYAREF